MPLTAGLRRLVRPVVEFRDGESRTALLMFAYSFLAMTAYNIVRPVTRSKFIASLGSDNLPWVQLAAGLLIGVLMHAYAHVIAKVPRRWAIPLTQMGGVVLLLTFWALFRAGSEAASVGFYILGLILGLLLISQFWTLANDIYDARHAKRLFGFIGGGASLGGAFGAGITAAIVNTVGTENLLLVSAMVLSVCVVLVIYIVRHEEAAGKSGPGVEAEGVGGAEAIRLLRESRHLQLIAVIIGCAAMGGVIIEQQLNMAAESNIGQDADGITRFLAQVTVYLSLIGFLIQITLTSRIHSLLGIGFALLILPVTLGISAVVMLFNAGLWAPALARVADTSLRYTVDKTTREILFLPLPTAMKYRAKPFIDVTVDRLAKALGALSLLVLIKPWGLALTWQQLSFASLTLMVVWIVLANRARREYLAAFRRSIARRDVEAAELRTPAADLQTVELLIEELAHPDERRVLYAIDLLESLDKRRLITPLLLLHPSAAVRTRTLASIRSLPADVAARWLPAVERLFADEDAEVRTNAVRVISELRGAHAAASLRGHLQDRDPRLAVTAAAALAASASDDDRAAAVATLQRWAGDVRETGRAGRLEAARALGGAPLAVARDALVPLILDSNVDVAREAIRSAGRLGFDPFFVAPLVSRLRHRLLKDDARTALVGYGEPVVGALAHFMRDTAEDPWVRRHVPATLARLPTQRTLDLLVDTLEDPDGFLRYKAMTAIEAIRREQPNLMLRREPVEALAMAESLRYFNAFTLADSLCHDHPAAATTLLMRALKEKQQRTRERVFRLLGLLYTPADMRAAWLALERGDPAAHASAAEYLDNVLSGPLRKRVVLMADDMPPEERVRRTNLLFRTRRRTTDDVLAQLIHDDDQVLAACAIHMAAGRLTPELLGDLEYALAHRPPQDWYVFEAASWALAGTRMSADERRARWLEPLPAVELADRLRQVALFDEVSVDELVHLAGRARQVRYERGRTVFDAGLVPASLQVLIEGEVHDTQGVRVVAPGPLAFEDLLAGRPLEHALRASDVSVTLLLSQDEFLTLLFDNVEIARGLFRMAFRLGRGAEWRGVARGMVSDVASVASADGLQPIERALLLQQSALSTSAASGTLVRLAMAASEVPVAPGAVLAADGDDPAIFIVISGAVELQATGQAPAVANPGDAVGLFETLSGLPWSGRVVGRAAGRALRIAGADLFELLASDVELLQGLFSAVPPVPATPAAAVQSVAPPVQATSP